MESKKLGEHIAKLRRERHMTQTELADRLYITEKAVSKWECGNGFPDLDNIGKLAAFFDISIDELLQAKEKDKLNKRDKFKFIKPRSQLNTTSTKPLLHGNVHNHATAVFLFPFLPLADIAFEEF